jgi:hypothetical protein
MEMLRSLAIGLFVGAVYVWAFAASRSYKQLVLSNTGQGRGQALIKKVTSMLVALILAIGSIIVVRGTASNSLAAIDFCIFLGAAISSGWLAWRYFYNPGA